MFLLYEGFTTMDALGPAEALSRALDDGHMPPHWPTFLTILFFFFFFLGEECQEQGPGQTFKHLKYVFSLKHSVAPC